MAPVWPRVQSQRNRVPSLLGTQVPWWRQGLGSQIFVAVVAVAEWVVVALVVVVVELVEVGEGVVEDTEPWRTKVD